MHEIEEDKKYLQVKVPIYGKPRSAARAPVPIEAR